jgi:hypothetical protein
MMGASDNATHIPLACTHCHQEYMAEGVLKVHDFQFSMHMLGPEQTLKALDILLMEDMKGTMVHSPDSLNWETFFPLHCTSPIVWNLLYHGSTGAYPDNVSVMYNSVFRRVWTNAIPSPWKPPFYLSASAPFTAIKSVALFSTLRAIATPSSESSLKKAQAIIRKKTRWYALIGSWTYYNRW